MLPSQAEFEALLKRVRDEQTESHLVDCKLDLPLKTKGDQAFFIRHVTALANNLKCSYLIIGVEDKTWKQVGLPKNSLLCDADKTQNRMNQILTSRLDPNISIRYRTYEVQGAILGLVAVEGTRAPYIAAIQDQQYGGDRTRGEPCYIYRGAIYVRHGASSVIANRQSEVLDIVSRAEGGLTDSEKTDEFLETYNYLDVESVDFGHHPLSDCLVEVHREWEEHHKREQVPAQSWISFVVLPVDSGCRIDTVGLKAKLMPNQRIGREGKWYHGVPKTFGDMFFSPQAVTPREYLGTWSRQGERSAEETLQFIRIRPSGHIEFGCTYPLFFQRGDWRCFCFVNLIGYLWQMVYLSKAMYYDSGFYGEVAVLLNLIGTKGTRMVDFAQSQHGGWASPFSAEYWMLSPKQEICSCPNIQIKRRLSLDRVSDAKIEEMMREIARDLGAYYGQDRPRCFDYHTDEFPHRYYTQRN